MEEFLNKLYSYEYFGTYLMIAIAVLVLLFIIVLIFGKKDQKKREIEETKKLQQINNTDAFKQESNVASIEVPKEEVKESVVTQEQLENDTIVVPNVNNLVTDVPTNIATNIVNNENVTNVNEIPEPVLPPQDVVNNYTPVSDTNTNNVSNDVPVEPILDKVEEKPLVFNDTPNVEMPTFEMPEAVSVEPTVPLVDVPDFNLDEITSGVEEIKEEHEDISRPAEVFSSVYAPQKEEIELPKLEEANTKKDDLNIELPTLKKDAEEEIEKPELNDYNLDNIIGEDYNINR